MNDLFEIDEETKKMWEKFDYIENNEKCEFCNDYTLVHVNPEEPEFMCRRCGVLKTFVLENIEVKEES